MPTGSGRSLGHRFSEQLRSDFSSPRPRQQSRLPSGMHLLWAAKGRTEEAYNVAAWVQREEKHMETYTPEPIDASGIELSSDLEELVDKLAQNNHDHWARKRIDEGWRHGRMRNDVLKEHPDLVPYRQLPESEKEYDRKTVVEALKAIVVLGYEIRKRS